MYDHILSLGLTPVVELSFMPRDLASDPTKTVFEYAAIVSPPKDRDRWYHLGRIEALGYWVVSDHFEELGRPPALLHGGFGLRTVGELRKPRWWALALLELTSREG